MVVKWRFYGSCYCAVLSSSVLQEDVDLVPSDIMAAMVLLERHQAVKNTELCDNLTAQIQSKVYSVKPKDWMTVPKARRYMRYACGAYGWPLYVFSKPLATVALLQVLSKGGWVDPTTYSFVLHISLICNYTSYLRQSVCNSLSLEPCSIVFVNRCTFHCS